MAGKQSLTALMEGYAKAATATELIQEQEAAIAKLHASEVAMQNSYDAIQIYGGYGYSREYPVERMWRDGKDLTISRARRTHR